MKALPFILLASGAAVVAIAARGSAKSSAGDDGVPEIGGGELPAAAYDYAGGAYEGEAGSGLPLPGVDLDGDGILDAAGALAGVSPGETAYWDALKANEQRLTDEASRLMAEQAIRDADLGNQYQTEFERSNQSIEEDMRRANADAMRQGQLTTGLIAGGVALDVGIGLAMLRSNRKAAMIQAEAPSLGNRAPGTRVPSRAPAPRSPNLSNVRLDPAQQAEGYRIRSVRPAGTGTSARFSSEALEVASRPPPRALAASREAELLAGRQSGRIMTGGQAARRSLTALPAEFRAASGASRLAAGAGRTLRVAGRVAGPVGLAIGAAYAGVEGASEYQTARATGQGRFAAGTSGAASGATSFGSLGLVDMSLSQGTFSIAGNRQTWLENLAGSNAQQRENRAAWNAPLEAVNRNPNATRQQVDQATVAHYTELRRRNRRRFERTGRELQVAARDQSNTGAQRSLAAWNQANSRR